MKKWRLRKDMKVSQSQGSISNGAVVTNIIPTSILKLNGLFLSNREIRDHTCNRKTFKVIHFIYDWTKKKKVCLFVMCMKIFLPEDSGDPRLYHLQWRKKKFIAESVALKHKISSKPSMKRLRYTPILFEQVYLMEIFYDYPIHRDHLPVRHIISEFPFRFCLRSPVEIVGRSGIIQDDISIQILVWMTVIDLVRAAQLSAKRR